MRAWVCVSVCKAGSRKRRIWPKVIQSTSAASFTSFLHPLHTSNELFGFFYSCLEPLFLSFCVFYYRSLSHKPTHVSRIVLEPVFSGLNASSDRRTHKGENGVFIFVPIEPNFDQPPSSHNKRGFLGFTKASVSLSRLSSMARIELSMKLFD